MYTLLKVAVTNFPQFYMRKGKNILEIGSLHENKLPPCHTTTLLDFKDSVMPLSDAFCGKAQTPKKSSDM